MKQQSNLLNAFLVINISYQSSWYFDYGFPCIFLPTYSPNSIHNIWIGLHAIINITPSETGCEVTLKNDQKIELPIQYASISKQFVNASMLYKHYMNERKQLSQDSPYHPFF
ncbi:competence protein ComK [Lysinibacillus fusiformis]